MDPLVLTRELIAIPSVNPFRTVSVEGEEVGIGGEAAIQECIETILVRTGFACDRDYLVPHNHRAEIPARWNLLAQKGSGPAILVVCHTDTVDTAAGWTSDPFTAADEVREGRAVIVGLGANDMKGGIAAVLAAAQRCEPIGWTLKLAFVVDEEFWSFGADKLVRSSFVDDVQLAFSPEIGDAHEDPEIQSLGIGRVGRAEYEIVLTGLSCHGADAFVRKDAINAVEEALELGSHLKDYLKGCRSSLSIGDSTLINSAYVSTVSGASRGLSIPDQALLRVERLLLPGERHEKTRLELQRFLDELVAQNVVSNGTVVTLRERARPTPPCEAYSLNPSDAIVAAVTNVLAAAGARVSLRVGRSVADENRLASRGIPTFTLGPAGFGSHSPGEYVYCASIERLREYYSALFEHAPSLVSR